MAEPRSSDAQPAISPWGQLWRVVGMLLISGVGLWSAVVEGRHPVPVTIGLEVGGGLVAWVLVCWRRRLPVFVAVVVNVVAAVAGSAAGPAVLATTSLATRRVVWEVVAIGVVGVASSQTYAVVMAPGAEPWWVTSLANVFVTVAIIAWGMYVGSRRELLWTLRQRAERAETEQELRVARARVGERAAIAREMHDVLAHRISQVSMHAGALAIREDLGAADLRAGAATIQEHANEALQDLRDVLGVLRDPGSGALLPRPQPTYHDLPELVARSVEAGVRVQLDDALPPSASVPPVVGRTVFRIVQEGITNAVKHAPGAAVTVRVGGDEESGVTVEVRNPRPVGAGGRPGSVTPGAGLGLLGLSERAELRGGRLSHSDDGDEFVLRGWIPWTT